jgi:hypothetical protein
MIMASPYKPPVVVGTRPRSKKKTSEGKRKGWGGISKNKIKKEKEINKTRKPSVHVARTQYKLLQSVYKLLRHTWLLTTIIKRVRHKKRLLS